MDCIQGWSLTFFSLKLVVMERQEVAIQVIQYCIFPRAILSDLDALFCAKFIQRMHSQGTFNFSTLTLYDKVVFTLC